MLQTLSFFPPLNLTESLILCFTKIRNKEKKRCSQAGKYSSQVIYFRFESDFLTQSGEIHS